MRSTARSRSSAFRWDLDRAAFEVTALHDGRATTLRDAILAHGGEAEIVRDRFFDLSDAKRDAVTGFLKGL